MPLQGYIGSRTALYLDGRGVLQYVWEQQSPQVFCRLVCQWHDWSFCAVAACGLSDEPVLFLLLLQMEESRRGHERVCGLGFSREGWMPLEPELKASSVEGK